MKPPSPLLLQGHTCPKGHAPTTGSSCPGHSPPTLSALLQRPPDPHRILGGWHRPAMHKCSSPMVFIPSSDTTCVTLWAICKMRETVVSTSEHSQQGAPHQQTLHLGSHVSLWGGPSRQILNLGSHIHSLQGDPTSQTHHQGSQVHRLQGDPFEKLVPGSQVQSLLGDTPTMIWFSPVFWLKSRRVNLRETREPFMPIYCLHPVCQMLYQ